MLTTIKHITILLLVAFISTSVSAQMKIKGKMHVSEGVSIIVVGELEGKENIYSEDGEVIINKSSVIDETKIIVNSNSKLNKNSIDNKYLANSKSINKVDEAKEELPIKYINIEGDTYGKKHEEEKEKDPQLEAGNWNVVDGIMTSEITRINLVLTFDYLIPIYSFKLNKKRFSDYAELYEFQVPTAILRPPIS